MHGQHDMGMMVRVRLALVTNAASGGGTDADHVAGLLRAAGASVSVHPFDAGAADGRPEDAIAAAAGEAAATGPDRLVVAGGDGSIGPVAVTAAAEDLPLAVVPTGTANDFARSMEIPLDLERACELAAGEARERTVDVLRAGDRPFLNAAAIGLSVIAANRARPLKRRLGALAYAIGAVRAGLSAHPLRCRVVVDGAQVFVGEAWQVIVAGTGAFGGGSELDDVDPADQLVDVAVLEAGPRVALVRRAWGMRHGGLIDQPGVHHARGRTVDLESPPATPFNVDGEVCEIAPARFSVRGERVRVICP
jgi:YegS/Rv2252/BmrU family lipid kinase